MKDRVPVNPGRVLITPENGAAAFYATMTRADNPTQEGTPLNKNSLLKDATAALFGLGADAVPDDVLAAIKSVLNDQASDIAAGAKIAAGSYVGTGTYGASNPCSLTFDFVPKLILIGWHASTATSSVIIIVNNGATSYVTTPAPHSTSNTTIYYKFDGNTMYWYSMVGKQEQNNLADKVYHYLAIG